MEPGESGGWVTARPPRAVEILLRIVCFPRLFVGHRDLISTSVKRELEARFKGTVLGWAWPLVQPLFLFAVYYFIFTELLQFKIPNLPEDKKAAMGVFMFVGITAWATMAETLTRGTNAIVENGNLIKKLAFPSEVLPLNLTLAGLVTLLFAIVMFILACVFTPMWPAPGIDLLWVPVILLLQGVFTYGLTLLLSTLQVFLRDTVQVVGLIVTVWMFATPLFWTPVAMKPGGSVQDYVPLIEANPIYHLVQAWRVALMGEVHVPGTEYVLGGYAVQGGTIPQHLAIFAIWAFAAFAVGYAVFVYSQRRFADEV
jgi:lipopolysaccharide transport system permease protein